jgi:hypothetical protein
VSNLLTPWIYSANPIPKRKPVLAHSDITSGGRVLANILLRRGYATMQKSIIKKLLIVSKKTV